MTRYRFEIDTDNAIRIWDNENPNENDAPFMLQPDWPDVTPPDYTTAAGQVRLLIPDTGHGLYLGRRVSFLDRF